jgi:O-antigen ligase/polysaccharide polymerase Wzy-like membrane protein
MIAVLPANNSLKRRDTGLLFLVGALFFLWSDAFNLRVFSLSEGLQLLQLVAVFAVVLFAGLAVFLRGWHAYASSFYFWAILGLLAAILFPTFVYLVVRNGLSPIEVFRSSIRYPGFFIFIALASHRTDASFVSRLNGLILVMATVNVVVLNLLAFAPSVADSLLIVTSERFGLTRLTLSAGVASMAGYAQYYLLVKTLDGSETLKKRSICGFFFLTYLWNTLVVSLGRRSILILLIVLSYYWLLHLSDARRLQVVAALFLLSAVILVPPVTETVGTTLYESYFSVKEEYRRGDGTVGIRLEGIAYYGQMFRDSGYLGIGLSSNRLAGSDPYRIGREDLQYNPGDHGIVSVLYRFGFPGILLTMLILIRMFRDLASIRRYGLPEHKTIAMGVHLLLVASIVGLGPLFWKDTMSIWTGLMFFMVWRMKKEARPPGAMLPACPPDGSAAQ